MRGAVEEIIKAALATAKKDGALTTESFPSIIVERSKREEFGDYATNIAMLLAKPERRSPGKIAAELSEKIALSETVEKCEVAGPGFINIFLKDSYWAGLLAEMIAAGDAFGRSTIGAGKNVQVEFVSANPTGPLHIGHGRGAAVGDALSNVLKAVGYTVNKEYYVNDIGNQMDTLARSVFYRYLELTGSGEQEFPKDHYKGDYIKEIAKEFYDSDGDKYKELDPGEVSPIFKDISSGKILDNIKEDLKAFRVEFDTWKSEGSLYAGDSGGLVAETITILREKGHVYDKDGAVWFATSKFGDDKDRVLIKADGAMTYFASDVAYHREKIERGFDTVIDIWGADHHGYINRVKALFKALALEGTDDDTLQVIFIQLVSLLRDGEPVAMSTRAGEFITLREVLDEVGTDACRFFFLMRKADAQLDFDLELAKKHAPENPVFYVQYCHARISSIIEHANEQGFTLPDTTNKEIIARLNARDDIEIIRHLAAFEEVVLASAESMEPHRITFYLQQLAGLFHPYYNRHRIVTENKEETLSRIYLCTAIKNVTKSGLALLGVSAPEKM